MLRFSVPCTNVATSRLSANFGLEIDDLKCYVRLKYEVKLYHSVTLSYSGQNSLSIACSKVQGHDSGKVFLGSPVSLAAPVMAYR